MKKTLLAVLAAILLLALALPVLAEEEYKPLPGTIYMYANKEKVKLYKEIIRNDELRKQTTPAKEIRGGTKILLEHVTEDGEWYSTLVEDTVHGGQMLVWVRGADLIDTLPQSFCQHQFSAWEVGQQPTCTAPGFRVRFCEICGIRDEQEIEKLGHSWSKWTVTKTATCSKKGERSRTCSVCGATQTDEYLDEHTYGSWTMTKEPTCTEKGERTRTCKVCGSVDKQALDKIPHDYNVTILVEATDHSSGRRAKVCKVCGYNGGEESYDPEGTLRRSDRGDAVQAVQQLLVDQGYLNVGGADGIFGGGTEKAVMQFQKDQGLNADGVVWPQTRQRLNHEFGPWITVKEMTRVEPGERMRVCVDCGYEQHETVESGTVFERGRRGEDIRALQQILKAIGYDAGSFDGIYGKKLDAALKGFADANGLVVEEGKVRPADVDAVVNTWFDQTPEDSWKSESTAESPVNLALTVNPIGEPDENGIVTYAWSVTNMGPQSAMFNALLLTFGDEPNFRANNLVMAIDGFELKGSCRNGTSGTFSADADWGEGNMNFAAMAVSEADGSKWLSNVIVFANESAPVAKTVAPVEVALDVANLPDGVYHVAFNRGDVLNGASGVFMNAVQIYTQSWYDLVDINALAVGDTIIVEGEPVEVKSLEKEDVIFVNRDQDAREFVLYTPEDTNGYTISVENDLSVYDEAGVTTLLVDPSVAYTDSSDIEGETVTAGYEDFIAAMQSSINDFFVPYNTTIRVENGKVVEINRVYVP